MRTTLVIFLVFVLSSGIYSEDRDIPSGSLADRMIQSRGMTGGVFVEEWEIPFLNMLSGPVAGIGRFLQWGAEYAAEEINSAGGIAGKPVKIIPVDSGLNPGKKMLDAAVSLEQALCILGPVPEPIIIEMGPLAAEAGVYCFTASTGYTYASMNFPWTPSWYPPDSVRCEEALSVWLEEVPEITRVVQVVESNGRWSSMVEAQALGLMRLGIDLLPNLETFSHATDSQLIEMVRKTLAEEPDGIILSCETDTAIRLLEILRVENWTAMDHILVCPHTDNRTLYRRGGDSIEGIMVYDFSYIESEDPRWVRFCEAFLDEFDEEEKAYELAGNYYEAVYMIKAAIEEGGVTGNPARLKEERTVIRDLCNNITDFQGLRYTWSNLGGAPVHTPVYLFQVREGTRVPVR